jgi:hypothetical protein
MPLIINKGCEVSAINMLKLLEAHFCSFVEKFGDFICHPEDFGTIKKFKEELLFRTLTLSIRII